MDQSFCRFNLSHLIVRDLKETQIKKGKNLLIVASLNDEKVVLRKIEALNSINTQENEIYNFYCIVNKNIATCLGFAMFDSDYYLVFGYAVFTVEDWVNQVNFLLVLNNDEMPKKLDLKKKVFKNLVRIFIELREREFFFEHIELSDMFIDGFLNVKIYNLSQIKQGFCSDYKIGETIHYLGEKIFGNIFYRSNQDEIMQYTSA